MISKCTCYVCLSVIFCINSNLVYSQEEPYEQSRYPQRVFWGDTHVHTNLSLDAFGAGNRTVDPETAYRFAKGQRVTSQGGMQVQLSRPLDFLVVSDHAENLGVLRGLESGDAGLLNSEIGREWSRLLKATFIDIPGVLEAASEQPSVVADREILVGEAGFFWAGFRNPAEPCTIACVEPEGTGPIGSDAFLRSIWSEVIANAERHYEPGRFSTFAGFEWTSGSIHRNVVFLDGPDRTTQVLPFSRLNGVEPEELWEYLARYEEKTGGRVLAIPHNGNTSRGMMFSEIDSKGQPLTSEYALARRRWEPLYEVTQIKGDGETHPAISVNDEFADFETWHSWEGSMLNDEPVPEWIESKKGEYARSALMLGLQLKKFLGENPFEFGMIGSTDSHTGLSAVEENLFVGKLSIDEPSPYRLNVGQRMTKTGEPAERQVFHQKWQYAAGGYAAIWAKENTRESLFDAMQRRETYATTGTRMTVRFFGGWNFVSTDVLHSDAADIGYEKGVPMGGNLTAAPGGKAPNFMIWVMKDVGGANLDRAQIIKGWIDEDQILHERIYDVALADGRKPGSDGSVPLVGNTVNVPAATYTNTIGDVVLAAVWEDPDFRKDQLAFYYLRVLEIPTPRWTAYDVREFKLKDVPEHIPMIIQERAYTSPIWYTP